MHQPKLNSHCRGIDPNTYQPLIVANLSIPFTLEWLQDTISEAYGTDQKETCYIIGCELLAALRDYSKSPHISTELYENLVKETLRDKITNRILAKNTCLKVGDVMTSQTCLMNNGKITTKLPGQVVDAKHLSIKLHDINDFDFTLKDPAKYLHPYEAFTTSNYIDTDVTYRFGLSN